MTPTVSVVIPAYNYGRFIGQALESVQQQTDPPQQVIVVDDGSTDDTAAVVRGFSSVTYIHQNNAGPGAARNRGVAEATSQCIVFLDADDRFAPDALHVLRRAWTDLDGRVQAVFGKSRLVPEGESCEHIREEDFPRRDDIEPYIETEVTPGTALLRDDVYRALLRQNLVLQGCTMVERAALEKCGGYDQSVVSAEDQHLWLRFAGRCRLGFVDHTLVFYRKHVNNLTDRSNWIRNRRNILHVLKTVSVDTDLPEPLRRAAADQFARTSDLLAQRLMDRQRFDEAAAALRAALVVRPLNLKSRLRLLLCRVRGLAGGDRGETR